MKLKMNVARAYKSPYEAQLKPIRIELNVAGAKEGRP